MPAAVPYFWAAWNAAATWATAGNIALAAAKLAVVVAASYGASKAQAKALHEDASFQSREWLVKGAKQPEVVVFGKAIIGGVIMYANQRHTPGSKDNFEVYLAVAHCAHEVDAITNVYFDNELLRDGFELDWTAGNVIEGKYGVSKLGNFAVTMEKKLGTSTQTVSTLLGGAFPTDWTVAHRARGYACTFWKFLMFSKSATTPDDIFFSGIPNNVRVEMRGSKVYDPRLDSTNGGSGAHRFATPSTWTWTENPLLNWTHYLTQYKLVEFDSVDWDWLRAQADICDVLVAVPGGTEKRFTCNGAITLGMTHKEIRDQILSSCMGTCPKVAGKWRPTAGAYGAPAAAFDENDIIGQISVTTARSLGDRYNSVKGTFFDPVAQGQEIDATPIESTTYAGYDGQFIQKVIALPFSNSEPQVQRIAYKQLIQSRQFLTVKVPLKWTGLRIYPGLRVNGTYGPFAWSRRIFRCIGWEIDEQGEAPIVASLIDDAAAYWLDPPSSTYSTRDASGVVTPGIIELPSPTAGAGAGEVTVRNPGFEFGFPNWIITTNDGTPNDHWKIVKDTSNAHTGDWVAMHDVTSSGLNDFVYSDAFIPVIPAQSVKFGGYLKTDASFVGVVAIILEVLDTTLITNVGPLLGENNFINTAGQGWTEMLASGVVPAGAAFVRLQVYTNKSAGVCWVDDLFLDARSGAKIGVDVTDDDGNIINPDDVVNGNIVVADSPVQIAVWFTSDGTNYTPTDTTLERTAIWKKLDGTEVARRTLLATRSGNNVTLTDVSSAGQPTVLGTVSGNGSSNAVVQVTYTSPIAVVPVTFQGSVSSSYGGGGGPSK